LLVILNEFNDRILNEHELNEPSNEICTLLYGNYPTLVS
jgi:hypothetical protein